MTAADLNATWAGTWVAAAHGAGLRHVVVAPGSRSTPLVLAFARHGGFRVIRHLDERSAAFFALGVAKATGVPAAVLTTSGTATANLYPAVIEADMSATPLLLLTADRPHRLRGSDANQTIDQLELYGRHVRRFVDVPEPTRDPSALGALAALAQEAVGVAVGNPPGPVHLNFPFDKPLEPSGSDWRPERLAGTGHAGGQGTGASPGQGGDRALPPAPSRGPEADDELVGRVSEAIRRYAGPDGKGGLLVVAGPGPIFGAEVLEGVVRGLGGALLADPLSGARYGKTGGGGVVTHYDPALRDPDVRRALVPGLVIRLGGAPTSAVLLEALASWSDVPQLIFRADGRLHDQLGLVSEHHAVDGVDLLSRLPTATVADYRDRWTRVEKALRAAAGELPDDFLEGWTARTVLSEAPEGSVVFLSSSMPIRDVDAFGGPGGRELVALGNRGASGIDGIVSTALGAGVSRDAPLICLLGDLALIHDANGLLAATECRQPTVFVVVDNDGGGIFHRLPIARFEPEFTEYFATPHGLDLEQLAALHRLPFQRVSTPAQVRTALREGLARPGASVVCVVTNRTGGHEARRAAEEQLRRTAVSAVIDP